jgi:hypothetical protein
MISSDLGRMDRWQRGVGDVAGAGAGAVELEAAAVDVMEEALEHSPERLCIHSRGSGSLRSREFQRGPSKSGHSSRIGYYFSVTRLVSVAAGILAPRNAP